MSDQHPDGPTTAELWALVRERADSGDIVAAVQLVARSGRDGPEEQFLAAVERLDALVDGGSALEMLELVMLARPLSSEELAAAADLENATMNTAGQTVVRPPTLIDARYEDACVSAAEAGNPLAMAILGCLRWAQGRRAEARSWLERGADAGFAGAALLRASRYGSPDGTADVEAWCRRAAESGHTGAAYRLGCLLQAQGRTEEAEEWFHAAATAGNLRALDTMGGLRMNSGLLEEAEVWHREAAWAGHVPAMAHLGGVLWRLGRLREADSWSRRAADAGNPVAMNNVGIFAWHEGRTDDARTWLRRAADAGHAGAADSLADLLRRLGGTDAAGDAEPS
ncbi:tetratricopeptide repeat protein [Nocardiopsis sp. NRRL B-16309]|uniref:tetratricopeptide repeat protein n=1 Tax=Nocardiopsis sp. NRRL B-16309 TaxID=1519494 RepID=UPI0006B025A6|nr:tetratricopeptide repeat protein [Nocardiopsis sp. NRRL B-16309]